MDTVLPWKLVPATVAGGSVSATAPSHARTTTTPGPAPTAVDGASDDSALVQAARDGHRQAFDVIVERHRQAVYRLCYRFVSNHEDASDLTQDVFVRAYRGLSGFKGNSAFSTWLYRIGVNVCLNRVSAKGPQLVELEPERHIDLLGPRPESETVRGERARIVRRAIASLPKKQRATLVLRVYHDLSHEQIASVLGNSTGTVKANFFHALRNLKRLLEEGGWS